MEIIFSSELEEPPGEWAAITNNASNLRDELITHANFQHLAPTESECHSILVLDETMIKLNEQFRGKKGLTDVITFPFDNGDYKGETPVCEIYICLKIAKDQAKEHNVSLNEELHLLLAHGLIHAIGIDHENSPEEEKLTRNLEKEILKSWNMHCPPLTSYG